MPVQIERALYESFGGTLEAEVSSFAAALEAHKFTVGVPAPRAANALVEEIVRRGGFAIVEPPEVPQPDPLGLPITAVQLRLWLLSHGVTGAMVDAQIAALPSPTSEAAAIRWEYGTRFDRTDGLIDLFGTSLGLTLEQIDAGWLEALAL